MSSSCIEHLLVFVSTIIGCLVQIAGTIPVCQICTCENNFFPPYVDVECSVSGPDFFSNFQSVTDFPSESYQLDIRGYTAFSSNHQVMIPVDAFASFAMSPPCCIGFYGFFNLAPMHKDTLRGLELQKVNFAGLGLDSLPIEALKVQSKSLLAISVFDVLTVDGTEIDPPYFNSFEALQSITIEKTPLMSLRNYTFYNLPSLLRVKISEGSFREDGFPRYIFHGVPKLESLQLIRNGFSAMPSVLSDLGTLKSLDLSCNEIKNIDATLLENLSQLRKLDLNSNLIEVVNRDAVKALRNMSFLEVLDVGGDNPFRCTCDLLPFIHWLQKASIHIGKRSNFKKLSCKTPSDLSGAPLLSPVLASYLESNCSEEVTTNYPSSSVTTEHMGGSRPNFSPPYRIIVAIVAVSVILSFFGVVGTCVLHRKLKRRWVGLFRRFDNDFDVQEQNSDVVADHYKYDAYVCHHDDAAEFVANKMIPELEQGLDHFKLCLSFRDFLVGADNLDNVTTAMESSRVVIILLDGNFISSGRCMLELNMACSRMLDTGVVASRGAGEPRLPNTGSGLMLVLLEALPVDALPVTLRVLQGKITCLEWSLQDTDRCWQQLKLSLREMRAKPPENDDENDMFQPLIASCSIDSC